MSSPSKTIRFVELLGRGGFGAVYLADVESENDFLQRVAIKVLSAEMSEVGDAVARQRDEARLLARLSHDNIVKVFDLIELQGRPAVLMEHVDGVDAGQLLKRGPLPARAAVQVIASASAALEAAYENPNPRTGDPLRVVHRDIKPGNILISRYGGVKVLDFGIARADFEREGKTGSVLFGTARYMAPEQWLRGAVSPAVDIYALGVTFVELLTAHNGQRVPLDPVRFAEYQRSLIDAIAARQMPFGFVDDLTALVGQMLSFEPQHRPGAGEVRERLLRMDDIAPGERLVHFAAAAVPPLLDARRQRYVDAQLPESQSFLSAPKSSGSQALPPVTKPDVQDHTPLPSAPPLTAGAQTAGSDGGRPAPSRRLRSMLLVLSAAGAVFIVALAGVVGLVASLPVFNTAPSAEDAGVVSVERPAERGNAPSSHTEDPPAPLPVETPPDEVGGSATARVAPEPETIAPETMTGATRTASSSPRVGAAEPRVSEPPKAVQEPHTSSAAPTQTSTQTPMQTPTETPPAQVPPEADIRPRRAIDLVAYRFDIDVYVDGTRVGSTPIRGLEIAYGEHTVEMEHDGQRVRKDIIVGKTTPGRYSWKQSAGLVAQ
ncbi:MAG: protein kinase [Myxococcota bacterium]